MKPGGVYSKPFFSLFPAKKTQSPFPFSFTKAQKKGIPKPPPLLQKGAQLPVQEEKQVILSSWQNSPHFLSQNRESEIPFSRRLRVSFLVKELPSLKSAAGTLS